MAALKLCGSTYEVIPDLPPSGFATGGNDVDEDLPRVIAKDGGCTDEEAGALLMKLRQVKERMPKMDRDVFTINLAGRTRSIPRNSVELAVQSLVAKTCAEASRFLNDFREVTGRTDTPVILAGGGSKLVGMKEALEEVVGEDRVFISNDAEYAIALGAALAGSKSRKSFTTELKDSRGIAIIKPNETQMSPVDVGIVKIPVKPPNPKPSLPTGGLMRDLPTISNEFRNPASPAKRAVELELNDRFLSRGKSSSILLLELESIICSCLTLDVQRQRVTKDMFCACELEANSGNFRAMALLGSCYRGGLQVVLDLEKAFNTSWESANHGDTYGQLDLGWSYLEGLGVPVDCAKAVKWGSSSSTHDGMMAEFKFEVVKITEAAGFVNHP